MRTGYLVFTLALVFFVGLNQAFCIYNKLNVADKIHVIAKTGRSDNTKEFSEFIETGESKCCHFSNRDCSPNGKAEDEMEFNFEFHWKHTHLNNVAVSCYAGGGLAVYGDELSYYAMCTAPDGTTAESGFHI